MKPFENTARVDDAVLERVDLDCVKSPKSVAFPNVAIVINSITLELVPYPVAVATPLIAFDVIPEA